MVLAYHLSATCVTLRYEAINQWRAIAVCCCYGCPTTRSCNKLWTITFGIINQESQRSNTPVLYQAIAMCDNQRDKGITWTLTGHNHGTTNNDDDQHYAQ